MLKLPVARHQHSLSTYYLRCACIMIFKIAGILKWHASSLTFRCRMFMNKPNYAQLVFRIISFPVSVIQCNALSRDAPKGDGIWGLITVMLRANWRLTWIRFYTKKSYKYVDITRCDRRSKCMKRRSSSSSLHYCLSYYFLKDWSLCIYEDLTFHRRPWYIIIYPYMDTFLLHKSHHIFRKHISIFPQIN